MHNLPCSCDGARHELIEAVKWLDSPKDAVSAMANYFAKVDDQSTTNNFCDLIKALSQSCDRMANPKLMMPLNSMMNLEKLLIEFEYDWPKRSAEQFNHIKGMFEEIEEEFSSKGLQSTAVTGIDRYKPTGPPVKQNQPTRPGGQAKSNSSSIKTANEEHNPILDDERLKNIDKNIAERILNEVVDLKQNTKWDDIAGLENVKQAVNEIVVYPMQNPSLFQGLLSPAKGLLLFGPPGTGKTLIGKCIASDSGATFFSISASSLTSKWIGEGEKMVRALFAVARVMQPSVVFIDEIDSLLTQRVDGEHDSSRRMKTEFLVQFDGVATLAEDRILIVGATNRPHELDEAARRRFTKRLYIPLPDELARRQIIKTLMSKGKSSLTNECIDFIVEKTQGFSGADMATLCKEAALGSIRAVIRAKGNARDLGDEDIPPIRRSDFESALKNVKASVCDSDLDLYESWDSKYGATRESACSTQNI